ncbi:MAG TPA: ABC transporter ATP-binding protein [bacterium]|jgi:branched-chain amino acid transport system ATP-binding protein
MSAPFSAIELQGVTAGYGETVVLENLHLRLAAGESLGVLGRNGVGKTTLLATLMGRSTLHAGRILFDGHDVSAMPIHRRNALGLGYVPQEREIFPSLTVEENLAVAARPGKWTFARVYELFPSLRKRREHMGNHLSGGEQQMLAIGRALVGNPTLLLLDEPSEGLAPLIVHELHGALVRLREQEAIAMVLVEQKTALALAFAERSIVMDRGGIVYDGESARLRGTPGMLDRLIGLAMSGTGAA